MRHSGTIVVVVAVVFTSFSVALFGGEVQTKEEGMVRARVEGVKAQAAVISAQAQMVNAVTGLQLGGEELIQAGERIINMERILNQEMGIGPDQDVLPTRFTNEPLPEGTCAGEVVYLQDLLEEYYAHRQWPDGVPSDEKRKELGLNE